jgi:hypothetical protein
MAGVTTFTQEQADLICQRIADGESLRTICSDEGMPATSTVFKWLNEQTTFSEQYARAREAQADALFDEILEIADDGSNDWMERKNQDGENIGWRENGEALRRSALRVDARKWMAAKLQPKKYGDRITQELTGKDGGPIETKDVSDVDRAKAMAFLATKAARQKQAEV